MECLTPEVADGLIALVMAIAFGVFLIAAMLITQRRGGD